jgi:hypothetical protein
VWAAVFGWLEGRDLCAVAASCSRFRSITFNPSLWRRLSRQTLRYHVHPPPPLSLSSFSFFSLAISTHNQGVPPY